MIDMDCRYVRNFLDDYFDKSLSRENENALEEHLLKCPSCRDFFEEMEGIIELTRISAIPAEMPSIDFFNRALLKAKEEMNSRVINNNPAPDSKFSILAAFRNFLNSPALCFRLARATAFFIAVVFMTKIMVINNPETPVNTNDNKNYQTANLSQHPDPITVPDIIKTPIIAPDEKNLYIPEKLTVNVNPETFIDKGIRGALEMTEMLNATMRTARANYLPQLDQIEESALYTVPVPPAKSSTESKILAVANRKRQTEVFESIQRLKWRLYHSGQNRIIPEVHKIETYLADIAAATEEADSTYLNNLRTFQEAEQCLLNKEYLCAIQNYSAVANHAPGSLMSFLAQYQTANVNFEDLGDFQASLTHYQKCLENYPSHYISEEKKENILKRIDLLTQNSMDNWRPLRLYRQSRTASNENADKFLKEIISKYPKCSLVRDAITQMSNRIISDNSVEISDAENMIAFFQQCRENFIEKEIQQRLQFAVAEILHYSIRNHKQALLEYTRAVEINPQSVFAKNSRERIQTLYRQGARFR
jgi:tetratricopeptide (TPR) repeat protein